jgi:hypothetical protein
MPINMTTDTPRTEAVRFEALRSSAFRQDCIPLKIGQELERELAASKAEVERLKKELADWDYGTRAKREQERAEKAEAECEKWRKVAESLAHKQKPKLDQRKFAKQDWWDKKLKND